jgi:protein-tyrosine-phosphatase
MSTKITLFYDNNSHFYQESFDEENVHVDLSEGAINCKFSLDLRRVMGLSKAVNYAEFVRQSQITDAQIAEHVTATVAARLQKNRNDFFAATFGILVYWDIDDPKEKQIETGIKYYSAIRDRIKKIVNELKSSRHGSPMQFGLEEIG